MKFCHFGLPWKILFATSGKIHYCPPWKNPSDAHVRYEDHAWERNFVYCSMDVRFTTFAMRLEIENTLLRNITV